VGQLFASCFLFGYYHDVLLNANRISRQEQQALAQLAAHPYAHKIDRCLMSVHALPFFSRGNFLAVCVLATICLPPLPPAACEHVRRPRGHANTWHVAYRRCGATEPTSVACPALAARNEAVWPGAKSTRLGGVNIFSVV
jgi:hypothetical protein